MPDTARPQTPTRKLFKPSNKTKTTPVRRLQESTPSSPESTQSAPKAALPADTAGSKKKSFRSTSNKLVRRISQSSSTYSRSPLDDIARSTRLAPLTSRIDAAESVNSDYAASDTTGDAPIGLIENEDLTVTEPGSRSTDAARDLPKTSDTMTGAVGLLNNPDSTIVPDSAPEPQSETPTTATTIPPQQTQDEHVAQGEKSADGGDQINTAANPSQIERAESSNFAEENMTSSGAPVGHDEIAKYLADQGHTEFSEFVTALLGPQEPPAATAHDAVQSATNTSKGSVDKADGASSDAATTAMSHNPAEKLPTNDDIVADPVIKANDAGVAPAMPNASDVKQLKGDAQGVVENTVDGKVGVPDTSSIAKGQDVVGDATGKALNVGQTAEDTSREGPDVVPEATMNGAAKHQSTEAPKEPILSKTAGRLKSPEQSQAPTGDAPRTEAKPSPATAQGSFDNMGKPARVNRSIEIPLPIPQQPTPPRKPIPGVDKLPSTDNLADLDDLDDPPEVFLDPNMEEPPEQERVVISPIPQIHKVAPINSKAPPDLFRLSKGLAGNTVDDVGNIVDESGKVLGHATGDLPSMMGKKVSDNGEIYGDEGELIGYVTQNFTEHAPPKEETPEKTTPKEAAGETTPKNTPGQTPLPGGLSVDTDGNILDSAGNIVGKLNNKPSQSGPLIPLDEAFKNSPKTDDTKGKEKEEEKEKEKEKDGKSEEKKNGWPADIFLDVKSTPDGIQLTIRIPTVFKQEQRET